MKFIRDFMDKIEPDKKSSPFLHTLWDGIDTFLYVPDHVAKNGTHIKDGMDLKRTMIHVVLAMQLAFLVGMYNIGHQHYFALGLFPDFFSGFGAKLVYGLIQFVPIIIIVHLVGLGIEFIFAAKKGHGIEEGFLVSAFLIPLIMPPAIPLWIVALATAFSVVLAKEAFGGTGMNIFNVALIARVFIFFAFPGEISGDEIWVAKDYTALHHGFNSLASVFGSSDFLSINAPAVVVDGWTGATPLSLAAKAGWAGVQDYTVQIAGATYHPYSLSNLVLGNVPGSIGEVSKLAVIIGALILVFTKIGSWRIMLSMVLGAAFMSILLNIISTMSPDFTNPFIAVPWYYQFAMGSVFFAMAFMATDPVTASGTNTGKWVYGFMIGVVGIIIRVLNPAYPEGWMLAILLLNVFAPLIDHIVLQQNIKRRLSRVKA
ncbi:MAG: NADH:ubiquinone reductase (Na(+)-transporting) subunit B [Chitinophagales bacterium]|nr:NADH:ubiquinone reductase (Na(+)-transporting) subunit B [Chitinophagales bacterium]